jgi:hypothetical protein
LTQQPPAAADPARRSPPSRAEDSARRRTIARRRAAVAVGGVAVVVIAAILLSGGKVPLIDGGPDGPDGFSFQLGKVQATPISRTSRSELNDVAGAAGSGVKETMDALYFRAFVDQGSWGDYEAAFELFEGRAATRAGSDAEVLTLGSTANDDFEALDEASGTLTVSVLTDAKDAPVSAVAHVEFEMTVEGRGGGSSTQVVSVGSFFLREVDGVWRIFAYQVDRDDVAAATPSPSGSPS